jgi:hypothetical protein
MLLSHFQQAETDESHRIALHVLLQKVRARLLFHTRLKHAQKLVMHSKTSPYQPLKFCQLLKNLFPADASFAFLGSW